MTSGNGDRFGSLVLFARNFLKHPSMLGWPLPSSRFLINELLKWVDWQKANVIVEYGPGVDPSQSKPEAHALQLSPCGRRDK